MRVKNKRVSFIDGGENENGNRSYIIQLAEYTGGDDPIICTKSTLIRGSISVNGMALKEETAHLIYLAMMSEFEPDRAELYSLKMSEG